MDKPVEKMTDKEIAEELRGIANFFADPDWFHHGDRFCEPIFVRRDALRAEQVRRAPEQLELV